MGLCWVRAGVSAPGWDAKDMTGRPEKGQEAVCAIEYMYM